MPLERLFYPRSIAVVGASPNLADGKLPYYQLLQEVGYPGILYPVNPGYEEINGSRVFPSLEDVPGSVDLAIVSVPVKLALKTFQSAVRKKVGFVHFFTSGFSEIGNTELEADMVELARQSGTRIVGPNCLGVLCSESKLTFSFKIQAKSSGTVAFLGQSGGLSDNFLSIAQSRGIPINKAVSYGNQIDLRVEDYLEYFLGDDTVEVVAAYIEDVKNGPAFLDVLKKLTPKKPVVVLKGGSTEQGAVAAKSHTGAMSGSHRIFSVALRQAGCIEVDTFEELLDVTMFASSNRLPDGPRIGFLGGGGGTSVTSTDQAARHGIVLPELNETTRKRIGEKISVINTSTANPVDLGAFGFDLNVMMNTMKALDEDDNLDGIVPHFTLGILPVDPCYDLEALVELLDGLKKPVVPIVSKFTEDRLEHEEARIEMSKTFRKAGYPVFKTMNDAANAIRKILFWKRFENS
ncbi:MAG: hypothetical protein GY866_34060 [Proteobacteria bacterium]|nr:hypothetical protein [Pseudomonadota bacterium]